MKFVVLAAALMVMPVVGLLARRRPTLHRALLATATFLPYVGELFSMNLYSVPEYRGESIGFELSLVDLVILALHFALPTPTRTPMATRRWLYFGSVVFSLVGAPLVLFGLFSTWKLLRMYALFAVLHRHAVRPEMTPVMLRGLALGAIYASYVAIEQRYLHGMLRCRGPMPHSNTLSMSINLFAPTWVALLLVGRGGYVAMLALGGGAISVVLAQSRTSLVLFGVAGVITFAVSVRRRFDGRKVKWALLGMLAVSLLLAASLDSILDRFAQAPKTSAEARHHFNDAAGLMLRDHPLFGIGINQYSHVLSADGYADTVGVLEVDRHGVAHHLYWLTLAELGSIGFLAYLALLLPPMFRAAGPALSRRLRDDVRTDVLLGLSVGYLITHVQGFAEWVLRQSEMSQLFWISVALVEGLRTQLGRK